MSLYLYEFFHFFGPIFILISLFLSVFIPFYILWKIARIFATRKDVKPMPTVVLTIYPGQPDPRSLEVVLENIGNAKAFDIRIDIKSVYSDGRTEKFKFPFQRIKVLGPKEEVRSSFNGTDMLEYCAFHVNISWRTQSGSKTRTTQIYELDKEHFKNLRTPGGTPLQNLVWWVKTDAIPRAMSMPRAVSIPTVVLTTSPGKWGSRSLKMVLTNTGKETAFDIQIDIKLVYPDTSGANNMRRMFAQSQFDGDISQWDVSNVIVFGQMFKGAVFSGDLSQWNTSNALDMDAMFAQTPNFNRPIGAWDVSQAIALENMFASSAFVQDISDWNVPSTAMTQGLHDNNPGFLAMQSTMSPFILGLFLQSDELPADPQWAKAISQVRSVGRGLGFGPAEHIQAVQDAYKALVGSCGGQPLDELELPDLV